MTLYQIINTLKGIALTQPNVKSATDGSVYDVMNTNPSVKYDVVHFSQTSHQSTEEWDYYGFNLFFISRLEDSLEDNRLQIQSIGKEVLDNIIRTFCENWSISFPLTITYVPFTQKFADLTAGVYCTVRIDVPKELICADDYIGEIIPSDKNISLQDLSVTITENGLRVITPSAGYDGIGEITINTEVPQSSAVLQYKELEFTDNGSYSIHPDSGYDGFSSLEIDVTVSGSSGYDEGYADGVADQKAKLVATSFTENSAYTREDGWSAVTVNVPSRYDEGYTDGFEDGIDYQKSFLSDISITQNGEYVNQDGYSAITVNVPTEGDADLIANLQGDYFVIPNGTTHLRDYAFYRTNITGITIPNSVTGIGQSAFFGCIYLEEINIPDSVTQIGSSAFSQSTALSSVTVGSGVTFIGGNAFYREVRLTGMTFEGLVPATLGNTGNSLGQTGDTWPIFVPCVAVDAYKSAWTAYASRIQCVGSDLATAITLNVASSITDSGQATVTVEPNSAVTDLIFSSSDTTKATIDNNGAITVLSSGTVTFCVYDTRSGLQNCKQVDVTKTPEPEKQYLMVVYNVTSTGSPTQILSTHPYAVLSGVTKMKYNNVEYSISTGFTFPSTGLQTVYYELTDKSVVARRLFEQTQPLKAIYFPQTVRTIEMGVCNFCYNLETIELNNGLNNLNGFYGCTGLTSLTIPNTVTKIATEAFLNCKSLNSVTLPASISSIGYRSFRGCSSLNSITVLATTPPTVSGYTDVSKIEMFDDTNNCPIYVPSASVNAYKEATGWSKYASRITAITT